MIKHASWKNSKSIGIAAEIALILAEIEKASNPSKSYHIILYYIILYYIILYYIDTCQLGKEDYC
jgi:hypothetical protein